MAWKDKDKSLEYMKKYREKNKEKLKRNREKYIANNIEKHKESKFKSRLKTDYGITPEYWQRMFEEQKGCCKICGKHQTEIKGILHVDHNHKTGDIRGLLCMNCNTKLGWYERNKNRFDIYLSTC